MALLERLALATPGPEFGFQIGERDPVLRSFAEFDEPFELRDEAARAGAGQGHHLVLVAASEEPEVIRHMLVKQPE